MPPLRASTIHDPTLRRTLLLTSRSQQWRPASRPRALHSSQPTPDRHGTHPLSASFVSSPSPIISPSTVLDQQQPPQQLSSLSSEPATAVMSSPLSILPLGMLLRNLATNTIAASPYLLPPSLALLSRLASSSGFLLGPDRNPFVREALKRSFYGQFCAGENATQVASTIGRLKGMGFDGVILCYGKEVFLPPSDIKNGGGAILKAQTLREIESWKQRNMETVEAAQPGDFVALKITGAGLQVFFDLVDNLPPPPTLASALDEICQLAASRNVRLLIDAEQDAVQTGIDNWALALMRKHNTRPGRAHVYLTYQAYLKRVPDVVRSHLRAAHRDGFTLGIKLVRGAYLASDPRHLIHDTKADTDEAFDGLVRSLLTNEWSPGKQQTCSPAVCLIVATHNADSVRRARAVVEAGQSRVSDISFAQLQGMADEVSCSLVAAKNGGRQRLGVYKYLVWGSTKDCMKYLLRRAEENRDAVQRTRDGRDAMWAEVVRRCRSVLPSG